MPIKDLFSKKEPEPIECGGNDTTQDPNAPKEIASEDMIFFSATSALNRGYIPSAKAENTLEALEYVSAFASPAGNGTFLFLETGPRFQQREEKTRAWAYVKEDLFPSLVRLVQKREIAKKNGYHSQTHGLPENFGGRVDIRYASGERIDFSDNGCPILSFETAAEIVKLFTEAMKGEPVELPALSALKEIRFTEHRKNGGFTNATLTLLPDGTGKSKKQSRYDDPKIYEREKQIDADTVASIKQNMDETGILAWNSLPANKVSTGANKNLTFSFEGGTSITVTGDRLLPDQIGRGFFAIELELMTN